MSRCLVHLSPHGPARPASTGASHPRLAGNGKAAFGFKRDEQGNIPRHYARRPRSGDRVDARPPFVNDGKES